MRSDGEKIEGKIVRIIYFNNENNYSILSIETKNLEKQTVVGYLVHPREGETYKFFGEWKTHNKFGKQFQFNSFEHIVPTSSEAIEQYLSTGIIHGIGPALAGRIVKKFGDETLNIINETPEELLEVEGIGEKKLTHIKKDLSNVKQMQGVFLFLSSHNISISLASKIYRTYGASSIEIVKNNPYQLITDVFGIGFKTSDEIAKNLGFAEDSQERIFAGLNAVLEDASRQAGHLFLEKEELLRRSTELLNIDEVKVEFAFKFATDELRLITENDKVYLPILFNAEENISSNIGRLLQKPKISFEVKKLEFYLKNFEVNRKIEFDKKQHEAIVSAISNPITIITGGPGTGKTLCINGIIELAELLGLNFALCAPTGRAAKRMTELTGREAKTIHRLLEYNPRENFFKRNSSEPLKVRILIVDEMSMVDAQLFSSLLDAVTNETQLILVGDVDQLPSVGPGEVLKDLINSQKIPTIKFSEIFRQSSKSSIILNSHKINHGDAPEFAKDFIFIEEENENVQNKIIQLAATILPMNFKFKPIDDIQILSPMHNGATGVRELNKALQKNLNGHQKILWRGKERNFHFGDKVMQVRNNYEKEIFNGDIGYVCDASIEDGILGIDYYGKRIEYTFDELDEITLAYAMTIHKSQGNEFPAVILPITMSHYIMLQRNLLYTAVSRAKQVVAIVGNKKALAIAIRTIETRHRNSTLIDRLKALLSQRDSTKESFGPLE